MNNGWVLPKVLRNVYPNCTLGVWIKDHSEDRQSMG